MTRATEQPDDPITRERSPACVAFEATMNAVLDHELGPEALETNHLAGCPACRSLALTARQLLGVNFTQPLPPPDLAGRIVSAAIRQHRVRRRRRLAGVVLAASIPVLVLGYLLWPTPTPQAQPEIAHVIPESPTPTIAPQSVSDRVAEAGSAFVAITRRARDQTINPTRSLLPPPETVNISSGEALPGLEPTTESLARMPEAARSGIEPVADKTRRAVNLFLRDVGLSETEKSKL